MEDEIQLGEVAEAQPQTSIRPDRDAHFSTKVVGQIDPDDLAIFVDLDVQRDMEAHALSNTRVELGGVLLGRQFIDHAGKPFVVISDCLRATHFEATKGTFKFTHETWREITRQREGFRPDLEMVGWYHTHPDWGVFLSGMDLFICNHFFNRTLDVALVIDPCRQERGWFYWADKFLPQKTSKPRVHINHQPFKKCRVGAICKFLQQGARLESRSSILTPKHELPSRSVAGEPPNNLRNLYRRITGGCSFSSSASSPTPNGLTVKQSVSNNLSQLKQRLPTLNLAADEILSAKENAYREILTAIVAHETGYPQLVDQYTELQVSQNQLQSSYQNQQLLIENLTSKNSAYQAALDQQQRAHDQKLSELAEAHKKAKAALEKRFQQASNPDNESELLGSSMGQINSKWYWAVLGGTGLVILATGFFLNQSGRKKDFDDTVASLPEQKTSDKSLDLPREKTRDKFPSLPHEKRVKMFFVGNSPHSGIAPTKREIQS